MSPVADPTLAYEEQLVRQGVRFLVGIDEVGRGAAAGPVCVGAVAVALDGIAPLAGLRDSKLLKAAAREHLVPHIRRWSMAAAVGEAGPGEIDALGMTAALRLAGRRAVERLAPDLPSGEQGHILVDGSYDWLSDPAADLFSQAPELPALPPYPVATMVKGDLAVPTVAAASVLAKVHRDAIMVSLHDSHPQYDWARNMGYKTAAHSRGIADHGLCRHHRKSWNIQGGQP